MNLAGAFMEQAVLTNANMLELDLSGADLSGVNITGANLLGAVWCKSLVFFSATICTNSTTDACLGCLTDPFGCRSVEECT